MALTKVTGSVIKDSVSLSGNVSVGGTLTYQDVTNVDALGIGTFRTGIKVLAGQVDVGSNIKLGNAGVITATSFVGSGANLTGIALTSLNINGNVDNRIITATGNQYTAQAESNLTYNGSTLSVVGNFNQSGSGNIVHYLNTGNNSGDNSTIAFGDSADADAGYINYDHGTNALQIRTNGGSNSIIIDSSGRLGINQSNPQKRLHISEASSNTITIQLTNDTTGHTSGTDGMTMGYSSNSAAGFINVCESGSDFTIKTGGTGSANERLRIESWGGIHNNISAIYGGGVANEPKVHFNGAAPSNDAARGQLAVSDSAAYNASPIARISLVTRYNNTGGYTFMGGIEGGKENSTDGEYGGFVRIMTRPHGNTIQERLRISSTGHVTKPASCAFNVTHNGNQNYSSAGTHTITSWKTTQANKGFENTTTGGYFSGGIFTAPVTGAYFFTSTILLKDMSGTNDVHLLWSKNNTYYSYWETRFNQTPTGYGNYEAVSGQCTMYMNAGDTCRIKITFTGSACGIYGQDSNWGNWGGFLIG